MSESVSRGFLSPSWKATASIPALALECTDISDRSSVHVCLNARSGQFRQCSRRMGLAASSAGSFSDSQRIVGALVKTGSAKGAWEDIATPLDAMAPKKQLPVRALQDQAGSRAEAPGIKVGQATDGQFV